MEDLTVQFQLFLIIFFLGNQTASLRWRIINFPEKTKRPQKITENFNESHKLTRIQVSTAFLLSSQKPKTLDRETIKSGRKGEKKASGFVPFPKRTRVFCASHSPFDFMDRAAAVSQLFFFRFKTQSKFGSSDLGQLYFDPTAKCHTIRRLTYAPRPTINHNRSFHSFFKPTAWTLSSFSHNMSKFFQFCNKHEIKNFKQK